MLDLCIVIVSSRACKKTKKKKTTKTIHFFSRIKKNYSGDISSSVNHLQDMTILSQNWFDLNQTKITTSTYWALGPFRFHGYIGISSSNDLVELCVFNTWNINVFSCIWIIYKDVFIMQRKGIIIVSCGTLSFGSLVWKSNAF